MAAASYALFDRIDSITDGPFRLGWHQKVCLIGDPGSQTMIKIFYRNLETFSCAGGQVLCAVLLQHKLSTISATIATEDFDVQLHKNGLCLLVSFRFCDWRTNLPGNLPFTQIRAL